MKEDQENKKEYIPKLIPQIIKELASDFNVSEKEIRKKFYSDFITARLKSKTLPFLEKEIEYLERKKQNDTITKKELQALSSFKKTAEIIKNTPILSLEDEFLNKGKKQNDQDFGKNY